MSANEEAWRRPPGHTPSEPAAAEPPPPAPRPAPRPEDTVWTRPKSGATSPAPSTNSVNGTGPAPVVQEYAGPPRTNPPPATWRPPVVAEPPPPGTLPEQDHDRIDVEEQAARTLTTGIGLVVGAVCLVLLLILCARVVF